LKVHNGLVFTCRGDGFINCFNLTTNELISTFEGHKEFCPSIVLDEEFLYSCGSDKVIKKWNIKTKAFELAFKGFSLKEFSLGHKDVVFEILLHDKFLFSASWDSTVKQWDKTTGKLVQTFLVAKTPSQVNAIAVTDDGHFLFAGTNDPLSVLSQWRISDNAIVSSFEGFPCVYLKTKITCRL
jgi:WD40 repeat protein